VSSPPRNRATRDPGADRASEIRRAFEAGASEARITIETLSGALKAAFATIAERDRVIAERNEASRTHIEDVVKLAKTSTDVIILQAQRDLQVAQITANSARTERLLKLLEAPATVLAHKLPALIDLVTAKESGKRGTPIAKTEQAEAAKRALGKILADQVVCEQLTALVGIADWKATIDWAVGLLD
jgi:hypothetical protein